MCIRCSWNGSLGSFAAEAGAIAEGSLSRGSASAERWIQNHGLSEAQISDGRAFLRRFPSVDIHSHPGRFFMRGSTPTPLTAAYAPPFPELACAEMQAGGVSAVFFATVADHLVLERGANGLGAGREFEPEEAIHDHQRQLGVVNTLVESGLVTQGLDKLQVFAAHRSGTTACFKSVEGGDFIEDRLERVAQAHQDGIRLITLIHYKTNQLGDTQTSAAVHGGLSPFGREVVREMDRAGVLVDLAHASLEACVDAVKVSTRPMLISHSNVAMPGQTHPRLISLEQARLVTEQGGVVGAVPAGFAQSSFQDYVDTILRMIDGLGVDHVAIGTDMDFTYRPVLTSYRDWVLVPAALLARGLSAIEVAQIMGGNFLRIMQ